MSDAGDMVAVTEDEFFAYVGPRDIILHLEPTYTIWETRSRLVVGRTTPGWRNSGEPKTYTLTKRARSEAA